MVYKRSLVKPITAETTSANAARWLKIVKYGESGVIIQIQDDCEYRITEILQDSKLLRSVLGPYYRKYLLMYATVGKSSIVDTIFDTLLTITEKRHIHLPNKLTTAQSMIDYLVKKGYNIGIFLTGVGELPYEKMYDEFKSLEKILEESHDFSLLAFSDRDITAEKYSQLIDKCSLLFDHIEIYPLYSDEDSRQFLAYNASMWNMKLEKNVEDQIVSQCGGYLWLISHVQRQFRDNPHQQWDDFTSDIGLLVKLESIVSKLSLEEKEILNNISTGRITKEQLDSPQVTFLKRVGLLKQEHDRVEPGVPLLKLALERGFKLEELTIRDGELYLGHNSISYNLSVSESKLLTYFIEHKRQIVTREELAYVLWGETWEKKYSDWAIDRLISRMRKKIISLGIDPKLLRTVKRKGYVLG